jgi:recombination protein RecA
MKKMEELIAKINKKFKTTIIGKANEMDLERAKISTGSAFLDYCTGGGFPLGRIVELYGTYGSGKTLISLMTIAEAQQQGLPCYVIDAEKSFDIKHAQNLGVDTDSLIIAQIAEGETIFDILIQIAELGEESVIFVDSVSSLVPIYEVEEGMDKQTMALQARIMSKGLRKLNNANSKSLIIFSNQIREKVGAYGNPETTSGGRALGHYASIRIEIRRGKFLLDDEKNKVGQIIKFKVDKNKVARPQLEGYFRYIYAPPAIDIYEEIIALSKISNVLNIKGSWIEVLGESFHGSPALEERLREDEVFFEALKHEVLHGTRPRGENTGTKSDNEEGSAMVEE